MYWLPLSFALHDMPLTIREKVLKEIVRVTKPNGMIMIVDDLLGVRRMLSYAIWPIEKPLTDAFVILFLSVQ